MYRILLKNATYFEFGIEIWIKNCLRDYSWCYLSGSALSDCSIQVNDNTEKPLGLCQR